MEEEEDYIKGPRLFIVKVDPPPLNTLVSVTDGVGRWAKASLTKENHWVVNGDLDLDFSDFDFDYWLPIEAEKTKIESFKKWYNENNCS